MNDVENLQLKFNIKFDIKLGLEGEMFDFFAFGAREQQFLGFLSINISLETAQNSKM